MPRPGRDRIGPQGAVHGFERTVEQHRLDPDVVGEVLEVTDGRHRPQQAWALTLRRAVGGQSSSRASAQRADPHETGDTAAAGHVGLEAVDCAGVEHAPEVRQVVAVLAGGDVHARRRRGRGAGAARRGRPS